ncbi:MAG: glycogen/starch synthase, partial [bacterium]|nr:glycogen/starch synthase [bacterium]
MDIFTGKKKLKVLFVGTEASPFVKVGGLASVMYSLPKSLYELGHDARIMIPRYLSIDDELFHLKMEHKDLNVPTGNEDGPSSLICNVKKCDPSESQNSGVGVISYFLENEEYYEQRANVYGYADDTVRFALLCRGVLEFIRLSATRKDGWVPDVIVSLDWQSGLVPNYIKTVYTHDPVISKISTVFSIHNLYYQGNFDHHFVSEMDFDDGHSPVPGFNHPRLSKLNWMRRGVTYADAINTVSPNYAKEMLTKDYGELLDDLLRERRSVLTGILNGIDYDIWNPRTDSYINTRFDAHSLENREKNKAALQDHFGLPVDNDVFVICVVSRLSKQKGLDLLVHIADLLIQELPMQIIVI